MSTVRPIRLTGFVAIATLTASLLVAAQPW